MSALKLVILGFATMSAMSLPGCGDSSKAHLSHASPAPIRESGPEVGGAIKAASVELEVIRKLLPFAIDAGLTVDGPGSFDGQGHIASSSSYEFELCLQFHEGRVLWRQIPAADIRLLLTIDRTSSKVVMSVDVNGERSFDPNPRIMVGKDGDLSIEASDAAECQSIKRISVRGVSATASRMTVVTSEGTLIIDLGLARPTSPQPASGQPNTPTPTTPETASEPPSIDQESGHSAT